MKIVQVEMRSRSWRSFPVKCFGLCQSFCKVVWLCRNIEDPSFRQRGI